MNSQRGDPRPGSRDGPQASRLNHPETEASRAVTALHHRPDCQVRRRPMTLRTHRETLTFAHPFTLSGVEDVQAPGAYTVQTDEELLEGLSFLAYRRVATVIFVPLRHGGPGSLQAITIDPRELADTWQRDGSGTDRQLR